MTVDTAFSEFLSKLTPSPVETEKAQSHRESIYECLTNNYSVKNFFRTGSFGNGTSISGFSDVDYFLVVPTDELKEHSNATLGRLRDVLESRFPYTGVYISSPAVVLPFGKEDWEKTEITIADLVKESNGINTYDIPNPYNGWMRSSPTSLREFIDEINERHNGKLKSLIRFVKAWKYFNKSKISSFYLELFVTVYAQNEQTIIYPIDIKQVIEKLIDSGLNPITDPLGVSPNNIEACTNSAELIETLSKLRRDVVYSKNALYYAEQGLMENSIAEWNKFYNSEFV